ncbi:MAG TPA: hypothetical protein VF171_03245 [Trueperaceae bacterium]
MPNFSPDTRNLTRGNRKALDALGVEELKEDEVSKPVRIRANKAVHQRLSQLSAKEIGQLLEHALQSHG